MGVSSMKMVNSRVNEQTAVRASRVLASEGLSISAFIRNSIEHIAQAGKVPECGFPNRKRTAGIDALRETLVRIESKPMPGKEAYAHLSEAELDHRLRMERYGY